RAGPAERKSGVPFREMCRFFVYFCSTGSLLPRALTKSSTDVCEGKSTAIGPFQSLDHAIDRLQPGTPARNRPCARRCPNDDKTPGPTVRNQGRPTVPPADRLNVPALRDSERDQARVRGRRSARPDRPELPETAAC